MDQLNTTPDTECACRVCASACSVKPGWFAPGEVEAAAELLGLTVEELFDGYLAVDWWEDVPDVFVLSPAVVGGPTGEEMSGDPNGCCVFLDHGRCRIHKAKPIECRKVHHSTQDAALHGRVTDLWRTDAAQEEVRRLLGREPVAREYSIFDLLASMR